MRVLIFRTPFALFTITFTIINNASPSANKCDKERARVIEQEMLHFLGGDLELNENEEKTNKIIMEYKETEWYKTFISNPKYHNHYFLYKELIPGSLLYQIIRKMPKGAALHIHDSFFLDADYLTRITYQDNLYACYKNDVFKFRFSEDVPTLPCGTAWQLMSTIRGNAGDVKAFDSELKQHFSLVTVSEDFFNSDSSAIWKKFNKITNTVTTLLSLEPLRRKYISDALDSFYDDGIRYIELRSSIDLLYYRNGTECDPIRIVQLYCEISREFIKKRHDFIGVKIIVTMKRDKTLKDLKKSLDFYKQIKKKYPDMIAGFDLVGDEEKGKPLREYAPALFEAKADTDYILHAGESKWFGGWGDDNLIDAIFLGAKRIGHGFSLSKHPVLIEAMMKKDIALEVCVVSNLVMGLVKDIRNHPLAIYLAQGLPVVLSSDYPGAWDAAPVSYDYYLAFVAIASRRADLRLLKQLAWNSIKYTTLHSNKRKKLENVFQKQWKAFLEEIISAYGDDESRRNLDKKELTTVKSPNHDVLSTSYSKTHNKTTAVVTTTTTSYSKTQNKTITVVTSTNMPS